MGILSELEPKIVFKYFEEICAIPHGSGNTKQISAYCANFAKERGLRYIRDEADNVIIFKDGTAGYENSAPVILQGHLDMVCEKTADCGINFETDGLSLRLENGVISADGTTLGGDDGIAVAYALAILDSRDIPHPPLEVVLTSDEEIGMLGAARLDFSQLSSRTMINIDSEKEGCLLVSCAGGVRANCSLPVSRENVIGLKARLTVGGLLGGHSGAEIHKGRANSNRLAGRALDELAKALPYSLVSIDGGMQDNAIPRETSVVILIQPNGRETLEAFVKKYREIFAHEYSGSDPDVTLSVSFEGESAENALDEASRKRVIYALLHLPSGVQRMSADIEGLVQTSLNMGILKTHDDRATMSFAVRSSLSTEKEELVSRIASLMELLGGSLSCEGEYPAWEYRRDSRLRELMSGVFEELYGRKPVVQAIHAGLECGLFAGALPGLDCVSFGPDMEDIHTTAERLDAASAERTWRYLLEVLKRLK